MAYNESDGFRIREALANQSAVTERKMFGGLAFMVSGHMCVGLVKENLMVRVGKEQYEEALAQPFAREMDFTGRPMKGMIFVDPDGYHSDEDLKAWVDRGLAFVTSLPPK
ncbi:MAG: TfoX/Sxy family protein [Candidatus Promineifilaceae bacterium]|nr:TfoX/Sxy family protein [Candidatus Promineifilaceae bacterium]